MRRTTAGHGRTALRTGCTALLPLVILAPRLIPNGPGRVGSLVDTMLPWTALAVLAWGAVAVLRGSRTAALLTVLPVTAWLVVFGGTLADKSSPGGDLTLVTHNVNQHSPDPERTIRSLLAAEADVLALEELSPDTVRTYERALAGFYPHHFYAGTVGLWSVHPLRDARALPIMPWTRAVRATVESPSGPLAVHAVHLPSVRVTPSGFTTRARDEALGRLMKEVRAEKSHDVVVLGDFNGSADDRALRPLTRHFASAQSAAGEGFGFTWPSRFPVVRLDQIFVKGAKATSAWTLPATPSDHRPVAARIALGPHTRPDGQRVTANAVAATAKRYGTAPCRYDGADACQTVPRASYSSMVSMPTAVSAPSSRRTSHRLRSRPEVMPPAVTRSPSSTTRAFLTSPPCSSRSGLAT